MGSVHLKNIVTRLQDKVQITALCDIEPERMLRHKQYFKENEVSFFEKSSDLIGSGLVDGVIIATPHYDHPVIAMDAFKAGIHVFCEKPAGVFTKNVREMNEAAKKAGTVFQVNFVLRSTAHFAKIKELIDSGEIGTPRRLTWIITNWYRTQNYYNSGRWRATWGGEGGGTLLNQNPHQLDLLWWFIGMPKRVRAFCYFGKRRNIEVEDEANLYLEYENGLTATYITTVSEFPGTNRLEIVGNKGKIVYENDKITVWRTAVTEEEFNATTKTASGSIPMEVEELTLESDILTCQSDMVENWVDAATRGTPLISSGYEGINSLMISNAAYLSSWTDDWVEMPIDEDKFLEHLNLRIKESSFVKEIIME